MSIGLSGMTALGAEVIWTRLLSLLFGATVYTFSLILAVFLLGLGIGSSIGSAMAGRIARPRLALGWCQMLLCAAMAWTAYMLTQSLPYWPINPSISTDPWFNFQLDFVRCLWAVLPGAILWGASFPLALASVATGGKDPARLVGGVYAANTLGAIIGSVTASLLLVVWLGSQRAQQVLVIVSAVSALLMLESAAADAESKKTRFQFAGTLLLAAAMGGAVLLARTIQPIPGVLVAYGRYAATRIGEGEIIYVGEGWNASVAVSRLSNGVLNYHNAGKVQASSEPQDMRLQRMLGHMTTLIPKNPESVLVIGCGAGVTAGAVSVDPNVKRLTIAEIEPLVPRVVSRYFAQHNFDVVANPKTHVVLDDARHYPADDEREVRRDHVGPARPLGQGGGDALHEGVLRDGQGAPESRRRRDAVRAALREQHRSGEERDRDVPRGVPRRRGLGQHEQRRRATTSCCSDRRSRRGSTSKPCSVT